MGRTNQETVTAFAEVIHPANAAYQQNRTVSGDNRLIIYFQEMKIYIPDGFQPNTLLKFYRQLKRYDEVDC